ncbi:CDGSH iron-sulfur domain-containing protein [Bacteroidota bacterium]
MAEPNIPQKAPYGVDLDAGDYWWCACGKSSNQPFCDGSHKGTEFTPLKFTIEEKKKYWLCGCKKTGNPPFCDGTHQKI